MSKETKFQSFTSPINKEDIPSMLASPFSLNPPSIAKTASLQLQGYLDSQSEWVHNFGLKPDMEGKEIGKMFGVLVVQKQNGELGYLAAFSGKLAGGNHHSIFVPPIYDSLDKEGFLNTGMKGLSVLSARIKLLEENALQNKTEITELRELRRNTSNSLQRQLFDNYHFLNVKGESKTPWEIFNYTGEKLPPSGAGECAAPKLFQYAFSNNFKPLAIAEFWWGKSTKSENQQHGKYYPACQEKCAAILAHMLD